VSRAASSARREKDIPKRKKGKADEDTSSDSDDDRATEKEAQRIREK
jgi:hypothetical protein